MKKLNRRQLRRLIEGTVRHISNDDIQKQIKIGLDAFNKLLKREGYHPDCTAMPSKYEKYVAEHMPKLEIKCKSGTENEIISFLKDNEEELINTPGYDVIEHTYKIRRSGRIDVHCATID